MPDCLNRPEFWSWYEFCCYILSFPTYCRCKLMRCFCFPSIFENSHFWKQKFVIFIIFLEMFQNPKSWCFLFQPQFRNVLKATNNSLYPFFQDFPEFEVLEINKNLFSLANLKLSFFSKFQTWKSYFTEFPFYLEKLASLWASG